MGAHASLRPAVQDPALEYYLFHHLELKGKREPRLLVATPNVTITVIADHYRWLLGDFTEVELTRTTMLSFFPPGSRAAVSRLPMGNISDVSVNGRQSAYEDTEHAGESLKAETSTWWQIPRRMTSPWIWGSVVTATIVVALCTKMPEHGGVSSGLHCDYRVPPAWSPDMDHYYSFRADMTDVPMGHADGPDSTPEVHGHHHASERTSSETCPDDLAAGDHDGRLAQWKFAGSSHLSLGCTAIAIFGTKGRNAPAGYDRDACFHQKTRRRH